MVVVLPTPLTPTTRMTCGVARADASAARGVREHGAHLVAQRARAARRRRSAPQRAARNLREQRLRRLHADVGGEQDLLELGEARLARLCRRPRRSAGAPASLAASWSGCSRSVAAVRRGAGRRSRRARRCAADGSGADGGVQDHRDDRHRHERSRR